jgi:hypothetical protein
MDAVQPCMQVEFVGTRLFGAIQQQVG